MSGGIALPQALQLISGVPLQKVGSVFAEKLSITKRLDGGAVGSLMQSVISNGNLSAVMQNPMAALTSAVQGQFSGLTAQLSSVTNSSGLVSAMTGAGGLNDALTSLTNSGNNLAGLTNGAAGFFSMLGHDQTAQMAGSAMPAQYATSVVTAPLASSPFLTTLNTQLPATINQVVAGTMTVAAATTYVQNQTSAANAIVSNSSAALNWSASMHPLIATVASVAGAITVPPVFDSLGNRLEGVATGFQGVLGTIVQPAAAATMAAASAAQIAHTVYSPVNVAAMTSLGS